MSATIGFSSACLSSMLLLAPAAMAAVVHLTVANGQEGSGWMFLDQDGHCKVATALHLVGSMAGSLRSPAVTDDHHHQWTSGSPILPLLMDIAIVPVPSADNPFDCGMGRLSAIGAESRVANMQGGLIEITDQNDAVEEYAVEHTASAMDAAGGEHFSVRFTQSTGHIRKGLSGGAVRDAEGLLGIVTNVDDDRHEVDVVRVDAIRRLLDQASSAQLPSQVDTGQPLAFGIAGGRPDPAHGPQQSLTGSGSSWRAKPLRHSVTLFASYPASMKVSQITLSAVRPEANSIEALEVSTQAGVADQA